MKLSIFIIASIAIMFAFVAQSCNRSSDKVDRAQTSAIEAERDLDIAKSEIEADVRIYRQKKATSIRDNELAITKIKDKIQKEDADVRAAMEVRIEDLERTNRNLKRQIDDYKITNRDNWDNFKNEFSSSIDDLGNSLDDFFSRATSSRM